VSKVQDCFRIDRKTGDRVRCRPHPSCASRVSSRGIRQLPSRHLARLNRCCHLAAEELFSGRHGAGHFARLDTTSAILSGRNSREVRDNIYICASKDFVQLVPLSRHPAASAHRGGLRRRHCRWQRRAGNRRLVVFLRCPAFDVSKLIKCLQVLFAISTDC